MQITRPQGIFNVLFDTEKADLEAKANYNKLGFLSALLIDVTDQLKNTNQYRQNLKRSANETLKECEKVVSGHFLAYNDFKVLEDGIQTMDVYNINLEAYEQAFKFFTQRKPHEIVSIMELIRKSEAEGLSLQKVAVEYVPIKL